MRRPTGPAQRSTPPAREPKAPEPRAPEPRAPEPRASGSTGSQSTASGSTASGSKASVLVEDRDERLNRPAPLPPFLGEKAGRTGKRSGAADDAKKPEKAEKAEKKTDAGEPGVSSRFETWRAVRRAAGDRRRVERGEARRFTARTRRRRQLQLACAAVVVVVIGGAVAAAYSPLMALRHIEVVGAHSVKAAQLQKALAGELGTPLPLVRTADIRHALDDFRLIESYSTQLQPPSTLVVRITERTPLAVVKVGSNFELVDQAGVVLAAGATQQQGYPLVALKAGDQPASSPGFAAAAAVIAALPASVRATVTGASATTANDVTLSLQGGKSVIWGGPDQTELKTADLQALLKGAGGAHVYDISSPQAPITQ